MPFAYFSFANPEQSISYNRRKPDMLGLILAFRRMGGLVRICMPHDMVDLTPGANETSACTTSMRVDSFGERACIENKSQNVSVYNAGLTPPGPEHIVCHLPDDDTAALIAHRPEVQADVADEALAVSGLVTQLHLSYAQNVWEAFAALEKAGGIR